MPSTGAESKQQSRHLDWSAGRSVLFVPHASSLEVGMAKAICCISQPPAVGICMTCSDWQSKSKALMITDGLF